MSLLNEYKNQTRWRNWKSYLNILPIERETTILDIGCSIGVISKEIAYKASKVIGVDNNSELIEEAKRINSSKNIQYRLLDARSLNRKDLPIVDGIWSSFLPAYFPKFDPVLTNWIGILKPQGWIALVEISDLFGHDPLSDRTHEIFENYYSRQLNKNLYDFKMGSKLSSFLNSHGLTIIHEENKADPEFTFPGIARPEIIQTWKDRFERLSQLRDFLGDNTFNSVKDEFLSCLENKEHTSKAIVKYIIALKKD